MWMVPPLFARLRALTRGRDDARVRVQIVHLRDCVLTVSRHLNQIVDWFEQKLGRSFAEQGMRRTCLLLQRLSSAWVTCDVLPVHARASM